MAAPSLRHRLARENVPQGPSSGSALARVLVAAARAKLGDKQAAVRMLAELAELSQHRYVNAYSRALLNLSLNNREEAIRWLERGVANHEGQPITWIKVDPILDPLRGDPRFEALVQKVVGENK